MEEGRNARRSGSASDSSSRADDCPDAAGRPARPFVLWSCSRGLGAVGHVSTASLMKSRVAILTVLLLLVAGALQAHDLFLRLDSFFVRPASAVQIRVLNGTFSKSENAVARDRLRDISVVGPAGRIHLDTTAWEATGDTSRLNVRTAASG